MECPVSAFQAGFVFDQSDVAVSNCIWLQSQLAQLLVTEVVPN